MATQSYVADMQSINSSSVQVQQSATQPQGQTAQQVQTKSAHQVTNQPQTATIIQQSQGHPGQQFIVTISGDSEQVQDAVQLHQGSGQIVYQPQYVEGSSSDPSLYAGSNGQLYGSNQAEQNYSEYSQAMYTPVSGTYYQSSTSGSQLAQGITQVGGLQGQLLTHQGSTYLVQGGAMDGEGHPLTHTTRASPVTVSIEDADAQRNSHFDVKCWQREVQWLIDNYETAEGVSLPRSTLYNHYLRHCQEQKIDPMNPASFGKLIRSVFLGLRTRRLGTRGNSKYHYYGIRIKSTSPLNQYTDDQTMAMRQQPANQGKRFKSMGGEGADSGQAEPNSQQAQHQQFLGDASTAIPEFGCITLGNEPLPEGVNYDYVAEFEEMYKEHCEAILDIVVNLQFSLTEALWQSFWRTGGEEVQDNDHEGENRLPKPKLYALCKVEAVKEFVRKSDYAFYQALVEVLIPDVLRPIPSSLTQAIRNFAKSLEGWLKGAMQGVPDEMVKTKVAAVSAFAQTLRRYTSLNHLAQAARAVLQNTTQITQMLTDLNRVDFANVQEQASWVCQCEDGVVHQLEQDFKKTLQQQNSLEQWAMWLESVVQQVLKPHEGSTNFPKAARQFLLKWSFYSSMVIRDLTLRSAASFGSFHLIRLLYDEYMFYLVEHKVAAATGETPIAVMSEFIDLGGVMMLGTMDSGDSSRAATSSASPVGQLSLVSGPKVTGVTMNGQTSTITSTNPLVVTTMGVNHHHPPHHHDVTASASAAVSSLANVGGSQTVTYLTNQQHAVHSGMTSSQMAQVLANNPTAMSVVTRGGTQPTKTIVVVPVSAGTGTGGGDAQPGVKKIKTN